MQAAKRQRAGLAFEDALGKLADLIEPFAKLARENDPLAEPWTELTGVAARPWRRISRLSAVMRRRKRTRWQGAGRDNVGLNAARVALHPLADRCRDLTKQIDLAAKLTGRVIDIAVKELDCARVGLRGTMAT